MVEITLPPHWEITKDDSYFFDDGRDYDKPMFQRKDGQARIYHNLGEEGTQYAYAIVWDEGPWSPDGDCCGSFEDALRKADAYVEKYL